MASYGVILCGMAFYGAALSGVASIESAWSRMALGGGLQAVLPVLLWLQLFLLAAHDTIPLGRWNNLQNFRGAVPLRRRIVGTTVNSATGLLALFLYYLERGHAPRPSFIGLTILQALLLAGELRAWWWPWMFGANAETLAHLRPNWEGTTAFLPERNGLRINALHFLLHASTLAALSLALVLALV